MPYVFSKTQKALGKDDPSAKQNVFEQTPMGQQAQQKKPQGLSLTGDGGGGAIGGGSVGSSPVATNQKMGDMVSGAGQQANFSNMGSKSGGTFGDTIYGGIKSALDKGQSDLQSQANKYKTDAASGLKGQYYVGENGRVDAAKVQSAYDSGADFTNLMSDQYNTGTTGFNPSVGGRTPTATSQAGVASALQNQGGSGYTKGMSRLDAAALRGNADFRNKQLELAKQENKLNYDLSQAAETSQGALDTQLKADREAYRTQMKEVLGAMRNKIADKGSATLKAYNLRPKSQRFAFSKDNPKFESELQAALDKRNQGQVMPMSMETAKKYVNPEDIYSDEKTFRDFLDEGSLASYDKLGSYIYGGSGSNAGGVGLVDTLPRKSIEDILAEVDAKGREKIKAAPGEPPAYTKTSGADPYDPTAPVEGDASSRSGRKKSVANDVWDSASGLAHYTGNKLDKASKPFEPWEYEKQKNKGKKMTKKWGL